MIHSQEVQSSVNYRNSGGLLRLITDSPTDKNPADSGRRIMDSPTSVNYGWSYE